MIWLAAALLLLLALAPTIWATRRSGRSVGRREAAIALHQAQLVELDRDLAERRIGPEEYKTATLEVQRRLLSVAAIDESAPAPVRSMATRAVLFGVMLTVPAAAIGLYLVDGRPDLAVPVAERPHSNRAQDAELIAQLRAVIARMDPHSEQAVEGNALLAGAEEARGDDAAAAAAWQAALAAQFNPEVAARAAEALTRSAHRVTPEAADLYRRALAAAPADAPWRGLVEQRLASGTGAPLPLPAAPAEP